jgi:NADPH:quinone reductase-like Zn-dependent oxidoreductase
MKAIQVRQRGPHGGEVLIRVHTSGVDFMDVYFREGKYKAPLPFIPECQRIPQDLESRKTSGKLLR